MAWSDADVALLRKLWAEGLSASQIAKQIGGVTRNAIIGKVHRIGLAGRASPSRPRPPRRPIRQRAIPAGRFLTLTQTYVPSGENLAAIAKGRRAAVSAHAEAVARSAALEPMLLGDGRPADVHRLNESMCKFPVGDPTDSAFAFCGRGVSTGVYCADHTRLCYQPSQAKKKRGAYTRGAPREGRDDVRLRQALQAAGV